MLIREAFRKKPIESVSMFRPPSDPPPPYPAVSALDFFATFLLLDIWGCLVRCETEFVTVWVNFDQNNIKQGRVEI